LVAQRAVRPYRVVFPTKPRPLFPGVGHVLELLALQEFVTQLPMERLDEAVLPRAPRRHRDRLRARLRPPPYQGLTDELPAVVAAAPRRGAPARADPPRQPPPHIRSRDRAGNEQGQALPSIFVYQRQPLEGTASDGTVGDEVVRPHVVLEPGRLVDAAVGTT